MERLEVAPRDRKHHTDRRATLVLGSITLAAQPHCNEHILGVRMHHNLIERSTTLVSGWSVSKSCPQIASITLELVPSSSPMHTSGLIVLASSLSSWLEQESRAPQSRGKDFEKSWESLERVGE
eukprot:3363130-Rhodomonas_salina.1